MNVIDEMRSKLTIRRAVTVPSLCAAGVAEIEVLRAKAFYLGTGEFVQFYHSPERGGTSFLGVPVYKVNARSHFHVRYD